MENTVRISASGTSELGRLQGRYFAYAFVACIFAYPISSYISEFLELQSNFLSVLARAATLGLVLWYLVFLIMHGLFRPVPVFYLFLVFWLLYSIRIMHDTLQFSWMLGRPPTDYYLFGFVLSFFCSFPFFVPVNIPYSFLQKLVWAILLLLNILGANNILTADVLFLERLGGNERLNPILFGMLAAMFSVVSAIQLLSPQKGTWRKIFSVSGILLGLFNLVAAASKSPVLFLLSAIVCMLFFHYRKRNTKSLALLLIVIGITITAVIAYGLQDMLLLLLTRFTDISNDTSSLERWGMLSGGVIQFLEAPVFGSFLEEKIWHEYPHNLVVEAFMATGIVGGTIFVIYFLGALQGLYDTIFRSSLHFVPIAALSVLILSMFSGGLSFSSDFWVVTATVMALAWQYRNIATESEKP